VAIIGKALREKRIFLNTEPGIRSTFRIAFDSLARSKPAYAPSKRQQIECNLKAQVPFTPRFPAKADSRSIAIAPVNSFSPRLHVEFTETLCIDCGILSRKYFANVDKTT